MNDEDDCESVFCVLAAKLSLFNSNFPLLPSQTQSICHPNTYLSTVVISRGE